MNFSLILHTVWFTIFLWMDGDVTGILLWEDGVNIGEALHCTGPGRQTEAHKWDSMGLRLSSTHCQQLLGLSWFVSCWQLWWVFFYVKVLFKRLDKALLLVATKKRSPLEWLKNLLCATTWLWTIHAQKVLGEKHMLYATHCEGQSGLEEKRAL